MWASKIWAILVATFVLSALIIWKLPHAARGAIVDSMPGFITGFPAEWRDHRGWAILSIVRVVVIGIALTAAVYYVFQNNWIWRTHEAFNGGFERFRRFYGGFLSYALEHRGLTVIGFSIFVILSCGLIPMIGKDFFPTLDAGQMRLHVRAPAGTRLEETERYFARVEDFIRTKIPADEIEVMLDNIGVPNSGINMSLSDGSQISPADGEILINLKENHRPTAQYMQTLRKELPVQFPELGLLVSGGGHRHAGAKLRHSRAAGCAGAGAEGQHRAESPDRRRDPQGSRGRSRRGRCAHSPGDQHAGSCASLSIARWPTKWVSSSATSPATC